MEPLTGFILYAVFALLVAAIAKKKGLRGWVYSLAIVVLGPVVVMGTSIVTAGNANGAVAATLAFLVPLFALVVVLLAKNGQQIAAETGQYGKYRKCPFCAEPVRTEAVKCKHCGSALEPAESSATSRTAT
ncbi:TPA: zinc ribbon domain-containing protein [Burkholderia cenocepacia]|uniref:zinc ribbon domain-containing protein n=1 Tax=Burkholderia cenocepacia TaxID=95486 RepID=UPI002AB63B51|nr:zinc ribbon domain-containing protein [Burkholderia cenocepacia]